MRKSRSTNAQDIKALGKPEAVMATTEGCRKQGVSPAMFCELKAKLFSKLKAKFGGMESSGISRLKAPNEESVELERLLAMRDPEASQRRAGRLVGADPKTVRRETSDRGGRDGQVGDHGAHVH